MFLCAFYIVFLFICFVLYASIRTYIYICVYIYFYIYEAYGLYHMEGEENKKDTGYRPTKMKVRSLSHVTLNCITLTFYYDYVDIQCLIKW